MGQGDGHEGRSDSRRREKGRVQRSTGLKRTSKMRVRLLVWPRVRVTETQTPSSSASKRSMTRDPDAFTASISALASRLSVAIS